MRPEDFGITKYKWNNGKLDVYQNIYLGRLDLTTLPFNFGTVEGDFNCSKNNLITLKGSPSKVEGFFDCSNNNIKILDSSCPDEIGGDFYFKKNPIKIIKKLPKCNDIICDLSHIEVYEMHRIEKNKEIIRLKMKEKK